jgi:superfamily II DNA helicase RecQ
LRELLPDRPIAAFTASAKQPARHDILFQLNQEQWMSDEVRVLAGPIAFGHGINKPGVRAVIHLALPKSIE